MSIKNSIMADIKGEMKSGDNTKLSFTLKQVEINKRISAK